MPRLHLVKKRHIIYACEICGCYHPWEWNGDCRDDTNRFDSPEDYAELHGITQFDVEVC